MSISVEDQVPFLSVSFLPSEEDSVERCLTLYRLRQDPKKSLIIKGCGILIMAAGLTVMLASRSDMAGFLIADALFLIGLILSFLMDGILPFFEKNRARKTFAAEKAAGVSRSLQVFHKPSCLKVENVEESFVYPLQDMQKIVEGDLSFFFLMDDDTTIQLPCRLISEGQAKRLLDLIAETCPEKYVRVSLMDAKKKDKQKKNPDGK